MTPTTRTPKTTTTAESPTAAASRYQQLRSHLAELKLHAAAEAASDRPSSRAGMVAILLIWAGLLYLVYWSVRTSPWH